MTLMMIARDSCLAVRTQKLKTSFILILVLVLILELSAMGFH
jgi:hypothetical protein